MTRGNKIDREARKTGQDNTEMITYEVSRKRKERARQGRKDERKNKTSTMRGTIKRIQEKGGKRQER